MQKGLPVRSFLAEAGQAQVLILAGIVLVLALVGGAYYFGRVSAPRLTSLQLPSTLQPVKQMECKSCSDPWDTSCSGKTCVVPTGATSGVCVPVLKMGASYTTDEINKMCGTNFSDETANWKTYTNNYINFKYLSNWSISGVVINSTSPKIKVVVVLKDGTLMNECMQKTSEEVKNNLVIKKFTRVTTDAMCSGFDPNLKEIWVTPSKDAYSPGISYEYSTTEANQAEQIFNQILPTIRFTN